MFLSSIDSNHNQIAIIGMNIYLLFSCYQQHFGHAGGMLTQLLTAHNFFVFNLVLIWSYLLSNHGDKIH